MWPVYGLGGVFFEWIHTFHWYWAINAFAFFCLIYVIEFFVGYLLERLLGKCPWDYGRGRYTIMGLVRIDYAPFWLALALAFEFALPHLEKLIAAISTIF
jgi:uncharacterized membrane protein